MQKQLRYIFYFYFFLFSWRNAIRQRRKEFWVVSTHAVKIWDHLNENWSSYYKMILFFLNTQYIYDIGFFETSCILSNQAAMSKLKTRFLWARLHLKMSDALLKHNKVRSQNQKASTLIHFSEASTYSPSFIKGGIPWLREKKKKTVKRIRFGNLETIVILLFILCASTIKCSN